MSIQRVNEWIIYGKEALSVLEIAKNGEIEKTFRGQISSFGAAVSMGNLKSAVAFFSQQANSAVARDQLLRAICYVLQRAEGKERNDIHTNEIKTDKIFDYVCEHDCVMLKNKFLDASVAIKLAMNLFKLV